MNYRIRRLTDLTVVLQDADSHQRGDRYNFSTAEDADVAIALLNDLSNSIPGAPKFATTEERGGLSKPKPENQEPAFPSTLQQVGFPVKYIALRPNSSSSFRLSCWRESLRYAAEILNLASQAQYAELLLEFVPDSKAARELLTSLRSPEWEVYLDGQWRPVTREQMRLLPNFPYRFCGDVPPTQE